MAFVPAAQQLRHGPTTGRTLSAVTSWSLANQWRVLSCRTDNLTRPTNGQDSPSYGITNLAVYLLLEWREATARRTPPAPCALLSATTFLRCRSRWSRDRR
jgi:hypothetical protein